MTVFAAGRNQGPRPTLPATEEAQVTNLAEYREQVDRGERASVSLLFDGLGADPAPRLDRDAANYIGGELEDMRAAGMAAARAADGRQPVEIHQRLTALVAEIDSLQAQLAETTRGGAA